MSVIAVSFCSEDENQKLEFQKNIIEWEKCNDLEILKVYIEIDKKL